MNLITHIIDMLYEREVIKKSLAELFNRILSMLLVVKWLVNFLGNLKLFWQIPRIIT